MTQELVGLNSWIMRLQYIYYANSIFPMSIYT